MSGLTWRERLVADLRYWRYRLRLAVYRRLVCPWRGHRVKFGSYPRCIYCRTIPR